MSATTFQKGTMCPWSHYVVFVNKYVRIQTMYTTYVLSIYGVPCLYNVLYYTGKVKQLIATHNAHAMRVY